VGLLQRTKEVLSAAFISGVQGLRPRERQVADSARVGLRVLYMVALGGHRL